MKKERTSAHSHSGGLGIASFVLGILSILFAFVSPLFSILFALIGLILAFMQKKRGSTRLSYAAMVLNIIGLALAIIITTIVALYLRAHPELLTQIQQMAQTP